MPLVTPSSTVAVAVKLTVVGLMVSVIWAVAVAPETLVTE